MNETFADSPEVQEPPKEPVKAKRKAKTQSDADLELEPGLEQGFEEETSGLAHLRRPRRPIE